MQPTDTPIASPQVVLREDFDDWVVLFHPLFGEAFGIDPVGMAIWKLLDGQRTLAQVAAEIAARCEDAPETILEDVLAFAKDLHRRLFILAEPGEAGRDAPARPEPAQAMPASGPPVAPHDEFALTLADGTCLTLRAGDEEAAPVVAFLAEAAQLGPAPAPLPPGARRLLAVVGVEQPGASPRHRPRYVSGVAVAETDADVVCVLEPKDVKQLRRPRPGEERGVARRFVPEPVTEEQWFWRQLTRISAAMNRQTLARGSVLLHSGLAEYPSPVPPACGGDVPQGQGGWGILLAGPSGVGKSTASARLPPPWRSVADDVTLVVRDGAGTYWAHPWPTWSRLIGEFKWEEGYSWDVHQAVPLRAVFFLEQGEEDRAEPVGPGHAAGMLAELAQQTSRYLQRDMTPDEIAAFNLQRFDNLCDLAKAVPGYRLHATLHGTFWKEIERAISHQAGAET